MIYSLGQSAPETLRPHPNCKRCPLHNGVKTVGIPTSLMSKAPTTKARQTCLLVIGEAPGHHEDEKGMPFVGRSGQQLDAWLYAKGIFKLCDVWLSNTVRCRPPQNSTPSPAHCATCFKSHMPSDLHALGKRYRTIVVLLVGASANKTVRGTTLDEAFSQQGRQSQYTVWQPAVSEKSPAVTVCLLPTFTTFHPAAVLRNPKLLNPVGNHLDLLVSYLRTGIIVQREMPTIHHAPASLLELAGVHNITISNQHRKITMLDGNAELTIDTETYGCLKEGPDQTVFNPTKSLLVDGVPFDDQIVLASATITTTSALSDEKRYTVGTYRWDKPRERALFIDLLSKFTTIGGQNIPYDVGYLRACGASRAFHPFKQTLWDLIVWTFLYDDLAPERSLKAVAPLYQVIDYFDDPKPVKAYSSTRDPALHFYCAKDSWATACTKDVVQALTDRDFGQHADAGAKTSVSTQRWFSNQLWTAILNEQRGVAIDLKQMYALHHELLTDIDRLRRRFPTVRFTGTGSKTAAIELIELAIRRASRYGGVRVSEKLESLPRTRKTEQICTSALVRNILIGVLPRDNPSCAEVANKLAVVNEFNSLSKLLTSYTDPLLYGKAIKVPACKKRLPFRDKPKTRHAPAIVPVRYGDRLVGMMFPKTYLVPRTADYGVRQGGTTQYRWSYKEPALHTFPKLVKKTLCSRFSDGILRAWDLSQIEWRTDAFISGDEVMLGEIADDVDIHTRSAEELVPEIMSGTLHYIQSARGMEHLMTCPDSEMRQVARTFYHTGTQRRRDIHIPFVKYVRAWCRQNGGKSQNFGWLYGAHATTTQSTCRTKLGMEIPWLRCSSFIERMSNRYRRHTAFHKRNLHLVKEQGALHLKLFGMSRTFGWDPDAVDKDYHGQVLDMPVQCYAALILQCAMATITQTFHTDFHNKAFAVMNWHDAVLVDCRKSVADKVAVVVEDAFKNNDVVSTLRFHYGSSGNGPQRKFPLSWKMEILHETV